MMSGSGFSLADIAAAVGNRNGNNGFGNDSGLWIVIILLALFGRNGNGLFGNGNDNNCNSCCNSSPNYIPVPMGGFGMGSSNFSFTDAAVQRGFDNQTVVQKLDGISNGICNLGYDQLNQMNSLGNIMQQGFSSTNVANMQSFNALERQLADCCCDNRAGQKDIQNAILQLGCNLTNTMNNNARDLSEQISNGFCNLKMEQKDAQIAALTQQLNNCNMQNVANDAVTRAINAVRPPAVPAYPAASPCGLGNWSASVLANGCDCGGCCR